MKCIRKAVQPIDSSTLYLVKRLIKSYLRPYFKDLGLAMLFMVLASIMIAIFAKLVEPIFDHILVDTKEHLILPLSVGVFFCFIISGIATYIHTILMNKIGQHIVADVQRDLFSKFIGLDLRFFHDRSSCSYHEECCNKWLNGYR
jgi:subfamily B ATP-binding cassette protein MsbA